MDTLQSKQAHPPTSSPWPGLPTSSAWLVPVIGCVPPVRYVRPGLLVFFVALLASLSVHLPVYQVLGELSEHFRDQPPAKPTLPPAEIEFEVSEPPEQDPVVAETPPENLAEPSDTPPEPAEKAPPKEPKKQPQDKPLPREPEKPKPDKPKKELVLPTPPPPEPAPRPKPVPQTKLAVQQKSDDPTVEPPPDAEYMAEENRRVEEETVARVTNLARDEKPQAGAPANATDPGTAADEDEVADLENVKSDSRAPERGAPEHRHEQDQRPTPRTPEQAQAGATQPAVSRPAGGAPERAGATAPAPAAPAPIVINDGDGTIVIHRPSGPVADNRPGTTGEAGRRDRQAGRQGVDLSIDQQQFESIYGEERLREERDAYQAQRKSKAVGGDRARRWRKFRAAIENYVSKVRPGEQTALNAAASPFAAYLATIHRNIHAEYALGYLRNLGLGGGPLNDPSLHTTLEIIINGDGTLHQIGIIRTSGLLPFDFGAFDAVTRAAPFTRPPANILSADGRVYVHWGFHRDTRQCGTFNATPFILGGSELTPKSKSVPALPERKDPLRDDSDGAEMGTGPALGGRVFARGSSLN